MAVVIAVAVGFSFVGMLFLRIAEDRILTGGSDPVPKGPENTAQNDVPPFPEETQDADSDAGAGAPICEKRLRCEFWRLAAAELVCLVAMGAFAAGYYEASALELAGSLLLCAVLWACAWSDIRRRLIPNRILLLCALLRCGFFAIEMLVLPNEALIDMVRAGIAAIVLFAASVLCRLAVPRAVGFGDIKLLMLAGFCLGMDRIWGVMFFTMLLTFIYSAFLLIMKRANMKTEIPYAPFLLMGTVTATFLVSL